jgi:uncharacterized membrane protein
MPNPIKPTLKTEIVSLVILIITIIGAWYFYQNLPEVVPSHWGINGEVNGYSSRAVASFAIPAMLIGMYLLFLILPYFDPKKTQYEKFSKVYTIFKTLILGLLAVIYFAANLSGLGYNIPVGTLTPVLIGVLFIIIGNYLSKIKLNWFVGIKTPWTLSSEEVWNKTHRMGGKLFMLVGLIFILEPFLPLSFRAPLFIGSMVILLVGTIGYSYWVYKKQ